MPDAFSVGDGREPAGRRGRLHLPAVLQGEAAGEICRAGGKVEEQPADAAVVPAGQDPRLQGERLSRGPRSGGRGRGRRGGPGQTGSPRSTDSPPAAGLPARRGGRWAGPRPREGRGPGRPARRGRDGGRGSAPTAAAPGSGPRRRGTASCRTSCAPLPGRRVRPSSTPRERTRRRAAVSAGGDAVEDAQGEVELLPRRQISELYLDVTGPGRRRRRRREHGAGGHGFEDVALLGTAGDMLEVETGRRGPFHEPDGGAGRGPEAALGREGSPGPPARAPLGTLPRGSTFGAGPSACPPGGDPYTAGSHLDQGTRPRRRTEERRLGAALPLFLLPLGCGYSYYAEPMRPLPSQQPHPGGPRTTAASTSPRAGWRSGCGR